jgi:hypothetical protein
MSDAASLRMLLQKTDVSAPAIQAAAGAMMKHYDKSTQVAVVEWRNALHQARQDQHLPLLYVANEVLQNSKRNRGSKFLEAFSPVLGQALVHIVMQRRDAVERVRRTVKIWGDRHVFSVRFVNELLKGLEPYRGDGGGGGATATSSGATTSPTPLNPKFSPLAQPPDSPKGASSSSSTPSSSTKVVVDVDREMSMDPMDDDDDESGDHGDDDSDDGDMFGDSDSVKLDISIDMDQAAAAAKTVTTTTKKRRRPSQTGTTPSKTSRRRCILSTSSLMELWNQVSNLQSSYDHAVALLSDITPEYLNQPEAQLESLVGDELLDNYKQVVQFERRVVQQRRELHGIAQQRRALEQEVLRYLPWLETVLKQDKEDMEFCDGVESKLALFHAVHGPARAARDERVADEAKRRKDAEDLRNQKEEEEERKKFLESAMKKETEAKPGMVWNKATGEYQYLHTDESWRD